MQAIKRRMRRRKFVAIFCSILLVLIALTTYFSQVPGEAQWYTGLFYHSQLTKAKNYFLDNIQNKQSVIFNGLYVHKIYGIPNVCGEINMQRSDGTYSGFHMFYIELVNDSPEKVAILPKDDNEPDIAAWRAHCGNGDYAKDIMNERFNRLMLQMTTELQTWSAIHKTETPKEEKH